MADEKKDAFEECKRTRDRVMKRWEDTKKEVAKYNDVDIKPIDPPVEDASADDVLEQVENAVTEEDFEDGNQESME